MTWRDDVFIAHAEATFGERLGEFKELGRRQAHPLARVMSGQLRAPRVLFIGNAAQSLHPVAAQGFNLGLRDVAAAIEMLSEAGADCGEESLLRSEEHTSELQSLMRNSYAVFCLKKKTKKTKSN